MTKTHLLLAVAVFGFSPLSFAHPGHGTAPATDASGKPHVHFGTPKTPAPGAKALPAGDKRTGAHHKKRPLRQELSHTR